MPQTTPPTIPGPAQDALARVLGGLPTVAQTSILFQNYSVTASTADQGRLISFTQDWIGVGVVASAVSGTSAQAVFKIQWSNDNATWTDDPGVPVGTVTVAGTVVGRYQIRGLYWRLAATVTGTTPVITCGAGAIF